MTHPSATRVLIVGGTGMLGHKVWQVLRTRFDTWATVRSTSGVPDAIRRDQAVVEGVDVEAFDTVVGAAMEARPDVIVNCVGIVKQLEAASDPIASIAVNALFPHKLAALADRLGARLLHISTDCVFGGTRGHYAETDVPDATDLYGRSKLLGEVTRPGCVTLRTSIIGRELSATTGLTEWFLSQRGNRVKGYTQARFSGVTTATLASLIGDVVERHPVLDGLYHVASDPISKYDLLQKLNRAFDAGVLIEPSEAVRIDRSLDGSRFRAMGFSVPDWDTMIADMVADTTPYDEWRKQRV